MKCLWITVAPLAAAMLLAADDTGEKQKSDHDLIQGTWKVVSAEEAGNTREVRDNVHFVITADSLSMTWGGADLVRMKYTLDATKRPKAIDTTHEIDPGKPIVQLGIYALDGDELKLCLEAAGKPRPAKLESKVGATSVFLVLKRIKEKEK
jgi:uncharacterized protein (TIGR03067 family)